MANSLDTALTNAQSAVDKQNASTGLFNPNGKFAANWLSGLLSKYGLKVSTSAITKPGTQEAERTARKPSEERNKKLTEFTYNLKNVARPNKFSFSIITVGNLIESNNTTKTLEIPQVIKFGVKSAQIPSKTIGEVQIKKRGGIINIPGDFSMEDLNVSFLCDSEFKIRAFFEEWMSYITDQSGARKADDSSNKSMIALKNLTANVVITCHTTEKDSTYEFQGVWPKSVSTIELSSDSENQAMEFQVSFSYSYWNPVLTDAKKDKFEGVTVTQEERDNYKNGFSLGGGIKVPEIKEIKPLAGRENPPTPFIPGSSKNTKHSLLPQTA